MISPTGSLPHTLLPKLAFANTRCTIRNTLVTGRYTITAPLYMRFVVFDVHLFIRLFRMLVCYISTSNLLCVALPEIDIHVHTNTSKSLLPSYKADVYHNQTLSMYDTVKSGCHPYSCLDVSFSNIRNVLMTVELVLTEKR